MFKKFGNLMYALPFMVVVFSVVTLYQANAQRLAPGTMVSSLIFGFCVAALFLLLGWLFRWTTKAAPLAAAGFTFSLLYWHEFIHWSVCLVIMIVSLYIAAEYKERTKVLSLALTAILIIGSLTSGIQAVIININNSDAIPIDQTYTKQPGQPNIYFIVPDRMPSPEAMIETGLDPALLVSSLRDLGFYVPDGNLSDDPWTLDYQGDVSTTRTMRFFASVLNGGTTIPTEMAYKDCRSMIRDNELFTQLHDRGYQVINYASWFTETKQFAAADQNITYGDVNILERFVQNELGEAYLNRTILRGLALRTIFNNDEMEIRRHNWQSDNILAVANGDYSSTFIISHIMLPHEPYVYADPEMRTRNQYWANIEYAMEYIRVIADRIRAADPGAIIIIQSDEGMAYSKPPELNNELSPTQWNGVFTAWYLPPDKLQVSEDGLTWNYQTGEESFINLDSIPHTGILDVVVKTK